MKISIITVVYNNKKTLAAAIESVISQKYENIEYIIIDGGSNDGTLDIISDYKDRLNVIVSEPDKGIYDAMNKGVMLATGDVIGILNSDDLYQDNMVVMDVMKCFNSDPELDIVYGDLVYVRSNDTDVVVRKWISCEYADDFFERGHVPAHPTLFLRKYVYEQAGVFDQQYKLASDYEFMLRIFKRHAFKSMYVNRLMVRMRLGGATNKSFTNIIKGNKEIISAWKNNGLKAPNFFIIKRLIKRLLQFI